MKKITVYKISNFVLIALYFITLLLHYNFSFFGLSFISFWFPSFCIFFSISMFLKTIVFKSDSSLWLSVATFLIGLAIFIFLILKINTIEYWPIAFSIISIASLLVGLVFKEIYQVKMAIIFTLISVPFYLLIFDVINYWWVVGLSIISLWLSIYIYRLLPERWYSNKK